MESDPTLNLAGFWRGGDWVNISESDSDELLLEGSSPAANLNDGACGAGDRCRVALSALARIKEGRRTGGLRLLRQSQNWHNAMEGTNTYSLGLDPSKGEP